MGLQRLTALLLIAGMCATVVAQQRSGSKPMDSPKEKDGFEQAHERLLDARDKASEASRLTDAAARALPQPNAGAGNIARKNFIDEHVFGRIERDRIPHAPLA